MDTITIDKLKKGFLIIPSDDEDENIAVSSFEALIKELRIIFVNPAKPKKIKYHEEQEVIISGKVKPKFVKTLSQKEVDELKK